MDQYQPIENYGIIGDLNTIALVGLNGSIDFMCFPDFDSPSVFAALLDREKGGLFSINTKQKSKTKQMYLPDTNVLITRFLSENGVGEITDYMPVEELNIGKELVRQIACVQGTLTFCMQCKPRFDYGRATHLADQVDHSHINFISQGSERFTLSLKSNVPISVDNGDAFCEFTLQSGEKATFLLEYIDNVEGTQTFETTLEDFTQTSLYNTINYWKSWIERSTYRGRWMEIVNRSALTLKLLISQKYGSMIAAATFSLPEEIGGERNWDYRYTWIRDASFTVYSLLKLGYSREAKRFIDWVEKQCKDIANGDRLSLMYSINGRKDLDEHELTHLEGYKKSSPVRIGNAAYKQLQLDIYGELLDSIYLFNKHGEAISYDFWLNISHHINWVCDHWQEEDEGIWEVRGGKKEFLYSRMMCWVALDRGIKIGESHSYPLPDRWKEERDKIFYSIHEEFWNKELNAFVQFKGSDTVDAATLLMPLIRFISPTDPKWLSTLKLIEEKLVSDFLVYRYRPHESLEGLKGNEGTFSMCTFWYVECLSKSGQLNKARLYFEKMLGYANHLGLYAEQLGLRGEHLGNFPQAFTHLGLISAALNLNHQLNNSRNKESSFDKDIAKSNKYEKASAA